MVLDGQEFAQLLTPCARGVVIGNSFLDQLVLVTGEVWEASGLS